MNDVVREPHSQYLNHTNGHDNGLGFLTTRSVLVVIVSFTLVNAILGFASGPSLALDDVKINILAQSFQWGYLPDNPPLFEWMVWLAQKAVGPGVASFILVKYSLFICVIAFGWASLRTISHKTTTAGFGALALLAVHQVGWNFHQMFTHSLVLMASIMMMMWVVTRLVRQQSMTNYALLGLSVGLGFISKYSFAASFLIVVVTLVSSNTHRKIVLSPRIFLTAFIALLIAMPHGLWVLNHADELAQTARSRLTAQEPYLARGFAGLTSSLWASILFFLPLGFLALLAPAHIRECWVKNDLWQRFVIVGLVVFIVTACIGGLGSVQERYAIAFLLPGVSGVVLLLSGIVHLPKIAQRAAIFLYVIIAAVPAARLAQAVYPGAPFCTGCRQWVPYTALSSHLIQRIAEPSSGQPTFVTFEDGTAGNLRYLQPNARVRSAHLPFYSPPLNIPSNDQFNSDERPCWFIWSLDLSDPPPEELIQTFPQDGITSVTGLWQHPLRKAGWRKTKWTVAYVPDTHFAYSELCGILTVATQ